jgi:hypothetical protein
VATATVATATVATATVGRMIDPPEVDLGSGPIITGYTGAPTNIVVPYYWNDDALDWGFTFEAGDEGVFGDPITGIAEGAFSNISGATIYIETFSMKIHDSASTIPNTNTIVAHKGSDAEAYATKYGVPFTPIFEYDEDTGEITEFNGFYHMFVPETIGETTIVGIKPNAFALNINLVVVIDLPETMEEIPDDCFSTTSTVDKLIIIRNDEMIIGESAIPSFAVIVGHTDSTAEDYATDNGNTFVDFETAEGLTFEEILALGDE